MKDLLKSPARAGWATPLFLVAAAGAVACSAALAGNRIDMRAVEAVEAGTSTRELVEKALGFPNVAAGDRFSVYRATVKASAGPVSLRFLVEFDGAGQVVRTLMERDTAERDAGVLKLQQSNLPVAGTVPAENTAPATGRLVARTMTSCSSPCGALDVSADGGLVAAACGNLCLVEFTAAPPRPRWSWSGRQYTHPAISPDGLRVAFTGAGRTVVVAEIGTRRRVLTRAIPATTGRYRGEPVGIKQFSPSGSLIAVADGGEKVFVWNMATGTRAAGLVTGEPPSSLSFSSDSRFLAAAGEGFVRVFDLERQAAITGLTTPDSRDSLRHRAVSFSPDGTRLAVASCAHMEIWSATDLTTAGDGPLTSPVTAVLLPFVGRTDDDCRPFVYFSPEGSLVAVAAGTGVSLWEAGMGRRLAVLDHDLQPIRDLGFAGGRRLVAATDAGLGVWDLGALLPSADVADGSLETAAGPVN